MDCSQGWEHRCFFFASVTIFSQCRQNFGNFGFFFVFSPQVLLVNNFDFNNFWAFGPDVSLRPNFFVNLCNFFLPNKFHILESERSPIDKNDDFKIFLRGMWMTAQNIHKCCKIMQLLGEETFFHAKNQFFRIFPCNFPVFLQFLHNFSRTPLI